MGFEIHLRIEHDELLLQALRIQAGKVVLAKMLLQSFIVHEVLRGLATRSSITKMASLVAFSTVSEQFVIAVEPLSTEPALRMTLETALVDRTRVVISKFLVPPQLLVGEEFMLVGEDFLVPCAEITHDFVVHTPYMAM